MRKLTLSIFDKDVKAEEKYNEMLKYLVEKYKDETVWFLNYVRNDGDTGFSYKAQITNIVKNPIIDSRGNPQAFTYDDMESIKKILSAMEDVKSGEDLYLDDALMAFIRRKVVETKWMRYDDKFITFKDDIVKADTTEAKLPKAEKKA